MDSIYTFNFQFLWVASSLSGSNKNEEYEREISRTIFTNKEHKIISKQVDSSVAFLKMKLDSDGEYKFIGGIKRTSNLENRLDENIPAYLQLFWTIKEIENKLANKEE